MSEINPLIKAYDDEVLGLQALAQQIKGILRAHNLAIKMKYLPGMVGVHPCNRSGDGLHPVDVHELLLFIARAQWSWDEVASAWAVEVAPSGEWRKRYIGFNVELAKKSEGLLMPVESVSDMKIVTVTHGNTTLRAPARSKTTSRREVNRGKRKRREAERDEER